MSERNAKNLYDSRVYDVVQRCLKEMKKNPEKYSSLSSILKLLEDYGITITDSTALAKAIEADDSYYEYEAIKKFISINEAREELIHKEIKHLVERSLLAESTKLQIDTKTSTNKNVKQKNQNRTPNIYSPDIYYDASIDKAIQTGNKKVAVLNIETRPSTSCQSEDSYIGYHPQKDIKNDELKGYRPTDINKYYVMSETSKENCKKLRELSEYEEKVRSDMQLNRKKFVQDKNKELIKRIISSTIGCAISIVIIFVILYIFFLYSNPLNLILLSLAISMVFYIFRICYGISERNTDIAKYDLSTTVDIEKKILKNYMELLCNVDIKKFLSIPENVYFDNNNQPIHKLENPNSKIPFGDFTRYTTVSGKKYHTKYNCHGATYPTNIITLSNKNYYDRFTYLEPCGICDSTHQNAKPPEWYTCYLIAKEIANKYEIPFIDAKLTDCNSTENK